MKQLSEAAQIAAGVTPDMIRVSVGMQNIQITWYRPPITFPFCPLVQRLGYEHIDDIIADFEQALEMVE